MPLRILNRKGAVQMMPFRKLGGKFHFFLRFCMRKQSKTYIIFKIINDESDVSSNGSKDSSDDDEEIDISDVEKWPDDDPNLNNERDYSSDYYVFFYSISNTSKYEAVVNFLKVGCPSTSLTCKLWLECQIRWPWIKGPVLMRSLPKHTLGMFISNYCQVLYLKIFPLYEDINHNVTNGFLNTSGSKFYRYWDHNLFWEINPFISVWYGSGSLKRIAM